eukprot:gene3654-24562_t
MEAYTGTPDPFESLNGLQIVVLVFTFLLMVMSTLVQCTITLAVEPSGAAIESIALLDAVPQPNLLTFLSCRHLNCLYYL